MMWGHDDPVVEGKDKGAVNVMSWLALAEELHAVNCGEEDDVGVSDTAVSA